MVSKLYFGPRAVLSELHLVFKLDGARVRKKMLAAYPLADSVWNLPWSVVAVNEYFALMYILGFGHCANAYIQYALSTYSMRRSLTWRVDTIPIVGGTSLHLRKPMILDLETPSVVMFSQVNMCFKIQQAKIPDAGTVSTAAKEDSIVFVDLSKLLLFSATKSLLSLPSHLAKGGRCGLSLCSRIALSTFVKIRAMEQNNMLMEQCPPTVLRAGLHS